MDEEMDGIVVKQKRLSQFLRFLPMDLREIENMETSGLKKRLAGTESYLEYLQEGFSIPPEHNLCDILEERFFVQVIRGELIQRGEFN